MSMKIFLAHTRTYIFRGILAVIPLALTTTVVYLIYRFIDKKVMGLVDQFTGVKIPGLGILMALLFLYFVGFLVSNVFGRQFVLFLENVLNRIPILKTTYQIGKQLSNTLSLPEKQVFKQVVLVDLFKKDVWLVGFVTGVTIDKKTNEQLLKVFVPTVPNPTTGFLIMLKEEETVDPKWSIEEGIKAVVSGGIIGADAIR